MKLTDTPAGNGKLRGRNRGRPARGPTLAVPAANDAESSIKPRGALDAEAERPAAGGSGNAGRRGCDPRNPFRSR